MDRRNAFRPTIQWTNAENTFIVRLMAVALRKGSRVPQACDEEYHSRLH